MKNIKVTVLVNTLQNVSSFVYSNHIHFFTQATRDYGDKIQFIFVTPPRMSIDSARNMAAKIAIQNEADYLMFLDDDVLIPPGTLKILIDADKDVVAGLVIIRGLPYHVMAFKWLEDGKNLTFFNDIPLKNGKDHAKHCEREHEIVEGEINLERVNHKCLEDLVPCGAVGFSCCLIKVSCFKNLSTPYFITGTHSTEDVYFCLKLKEGMERRGLGEPSIFMHTQIECGHLLTVEPVAWENRRSHLYEYYTDIQKKETVKYKGRELAHLSKMIEVLK